MKSVWKVQIEVPVIASISDDCAWVTLRGRGDYANAEEARQGLERAKAEHEWPLRVVEVVSFEGDEEPDSSTY